MKKTIILIAALLSISSAAAYAQEEKKDAKERLAEIEAMTVKAKKAKKARFAEKNLFDFDVLNYSGYGLHSISGSADWNMGNSREIILNILDLKLNPTNWLSINAGFDLKWNKFCSKKNYFEVSGGALTSNVPSLTADPAPKYKKSDIRTFSLSVPASIGFSVGKLGLNLGVEGVYNANKYTRVKTRYTLDGSEYIKKTKGGEVEKYQLNYLALIRFSDIGLYYKYCPKPLVPGNDMAKHYQTIGFILYM
ncbi:MAG: hypothetical protein IKZ71_01205 [Bacteroidales bacterium]|nr:hypothetical protein [Bacteroidales bacterium]